MFLQKDNLPAQDDLARRHFLVQLIHVFGKFHIHSHLRNGRQPVTGCLAQRATRAPAGSSGSAGVAPRRKKPGSARAASVPHPRTRCAGRRSSWWPPPSACPRCLREGEEGRTAGKGGAAGGAGAAPRPRRAGQGRAAALTQQRPDHPRRALVAPLEAVHDGGEHNRV